ncbi:MAG TPA: CCA tRNA nucleotidyltransferase [Peptococcaceae bacterium]|nr:CCA tRNA nucleotidyltransferase [Peptococcaceae bacterium]
MNDFQQQVIAILKEHAPIWLVGGVVRDQLLGMPSQDIDLVSPLQPEKAEEILRKNNFEPLRLGKNFNTLTLFTENKRIDLVYAENLFQDAMGRDFTINAIYLEPNSGEIFDPFDGRKDLEDKVLKCCGTPEDRFREDPLRILRMVKFAVKYQMKIEEKTWEEARKLLDLLANVSKERITAELAEILVLEEAEKAARLLAEVGYWDVFVPELARLQGIVQNEYHSLDVWEHTMAVFRNTPPDLFLRLAALFHDIGKWETASRECFLSGKLEYSENKYRIDKYVIIGTRGKGELDSKLRPLIGKEIKILGARLDEYPDIVQFKRLLLGEDLKKGISYVEKGKRHFLNHEKASARLLAEILQRYTFTMHFAGGGQKRQDDLLKLVENHMQATLTFMPEFRGGKAKNPFEERAAELVWKLCWDGRIFEVQNIHDFVVLWRADFMAGKVHTEAQIKLFEEIQAELINVALWQKETLSKFNWYLLQDFAANQGLSGASLGRFKNFVRAKAMRERQPEINLPFLKKAYVQFNKR